MKEAWPDGFVCAPSESKRSLFKPIRLTKGGVASLDTDMLISNSISRHIKACRMTRTR